MLSTKVDPLGRTVLQILNNKGMPQCGKKNLVPMIGVRTRTLTWTEHYEMEGYHLNLYNRFDYFPLTKPWKVYKIVKGYRGNLANNKAFCLEIWILNGEQRMNLFENCITLFKIICREGKYACKVISQIS